MSEPWLRDRGELGHIRAGPLRLRPRVSFRTASTRQGHIGAGVTVRDRVNVEAVEGGPVGDQRVAVSTHHAGQVSGRKAVRCREATCCSHAAALVCVRQLPGGQGTRLAWPGRRSSRGLTGWREPRPVRPRRGWYPYPPMAAVCEVCGKHSSVGMSISHSHRRTKRRWYPNIQRVRAIVGGSPRRVSVCTSCIRAGKVTKPAR